MPRFIRAFILIPLIGICPSLSRAVLETVELSIQNMHCGKCVATLQKAITRVPGVSKASVDLAQKKATVTYDQDQAKLNDIIKVIADEGCPSSLLLRKTEAPTYTVEVTESSVQ